MRAHLIRLGFLGSLVVLIGLYACATVAPLDKALDEAQKTQEAVLSRASYEQLRPAIEKINIGDTRSKVLALVRPKEEKGKFFLKEERGETKLVQFLNWPGVLTPFNPLRFASPEKLEVMHFGYLDGRWLVPRKILIFENDKVLKIIDVPDPIALWTGPGATVLEAGPLAHLSRQAYEKVFLREKDRILPGMHIWEVYSLLGANYHMTPDAQSFVVFCPGYLNYKGPAKAERSAEGVRTVYPFGYMEGDIEIVKWELETLNGRVVCVRPHEGR